MNQIKTTAKQTKTPTPLDIAHQILSKRQPGFSGLKPIAKGHNSLAFVYQFEKSWRVLRLSAHDAKAYHTDRWAWNFLAQQGVRVPHVFEVGRVAGLAYALSVFCHGNHLRNHNLQLALPSLFEQLSCLHRCAIPLDSIQKKNDAKQYQDWKSLVRYYSHAAISKRKQILGQELSLNPIFEEIESKLETQLAALPDNLGLYPLHGDLNASNLLFKDGQLNVLLDWNDSNIGDFLYDLASFLLKTDLPDPISAKHLFLSHYAQKGFDLNFAEFRFQTNLALAALIILPYHHLLNSKDKYERALRYYKKLSGS